LRPVRFQKRPSPPPLHPYAFPEGFSGIISDIVAMESQPLFQKNKRRIYVAYDHHRDMAAYDAFVRLFSSVCDIIRDNSMERELDSAVAEEHVLRLRDEVLSGTVCTVVLCGAHTHEDKFVDWDGGFAIICRWHELAQDKVDLTQRITFAADRPRDLIDNGLPLSR
jgi:MTH538 TIR-like domain (DUF1863)